jgi:uncharacterized protein YggU (UPF0235/DUF167 family)
VPIGQKAELQILNEELDLRVQMQTEALQQTLQELEQQTLRIRISC